MIGWMRDDGAAFIGTPVKHLAFCIFLPRADVRFSSHLLMPLLRFKPPDCQPPY